MYLALKHTHLALVTISVTFFVLRFFWLMRDSDMLKKKWVKVSPHMIDTFLLLSGVALIVMTGFSPFNPHVVWMSEKLICILIYIVLGFVALHYGRGTPLKVFAFLAALGWVFVAGKLAITKMPLLLG